MAISREKRVERAQMKVLFTVPFFAPAVAKLPVVFDKETKTASTDGKRILWNPDWFDTLPDAVLPTVLCHEAGHCLFGHLWRAPSGADWDAWNEATDHIVNNMLKEFGETVTAKNLANPFPFPDPQDAYLANPAFRGFAEEKVYSMLANRPKGPGGNPGGQGGQTGQSQGQGQGQGKGKGKGKPGQGQGGKPEPHSMPDFGQMLKPSGADPGQKKLANNWDQTMGQCAQMAKGRGNIPGCISQYVEELFESKVPWFEILRNWLREQAADDWNWMKPNTYFDESGFILPSLDSEKIGAIVFGKDTSGSIMCYPEAVAQFVTEQQTCLDELRPSKLVDICCDTRIQRVKEYTVGDAIDRDTPGGGGTSFVPVFEHCKELLPAPKCVVYLTDLDGDFPKEAPEYPVLWVVYGGSKTKVPFGEVVYID